MSKDEYKTIDGQSVFIGGYDDIPEGATLWNGFNYNAQKWIYNGKPDTRTLEELQQSI